MSASRDAAVNIIRRLRDAGHVAYLAGGCVRDRLLGRSPKDHDVATDAPPDVVRHLFKRSQAVGEAFGVVLVYQGRHPERIATEVATFRTEGPYSDHRRPDQVTFTDARHDAQRRDFTINGLFEDPLHPEHPNPDADDDGVIDYVGGRADLRDGMIRAIGDASQRFGEDYLRMLRAVRFSSRLGFDLEPTTAAAIRGLARFLGQISRERIGGELLTMLSHPRRGEACRLLHDLRLDGPALNEDHADTSLSWVDGLPDDADFAVALAAWMLDRGGPLGVSAHRITRWRRALSLSNDHTDRLRRALQHLHTAEQWDQLSTAQRKRLLSSTDWDGTLLLLRAQDRAAAIEEDAASLAGDGVGLCPEPWLTGGDLIALGLEPGPRFKTLLDGVFDAQLESEVMNRDQALAWVQGRLQGP